MVKTGRTRVPRQKRPAALVVKPPAPADAGEAELASFVDEVVDEVNRLLRRSNALHDEVADLLFMKLLGSDASSAFDPKRYLLTRYARVRAEAGRSLDLSPYDFSVHVRIGALNQRVRNAAWRGLDWSFKCALLPLVVRHKDGRLDLEVFREGLLYAAKARTRVEDVRAFVVKKLPDLPGRVGRPRGLTLAGGTRFVDRGIALLDPKQRAAFVERVLSAPEEQREAFVESLGELTAGLQELLDELR